MTDFLEYTCTVFFFFTVFLYYMCHSHQNTITTVQFFKTASVALVTIFSFVTSGCLLVRDMYCQVNEACVVPMT